MSQAAEEFLHDLGAPEAVRPANAVTHAHPLAVPELDPPRPAPAERAPLSPAADAVPALPEALHHLKVALAVRVGAAELTIGELLTAKEQHVIKLDRRVDHPVELLLGGRVVARGLLVAVDECFGVRVTEIGATVELPPRSRLG